MIPRPSVNGRREALYVLRDATDPGERAMIAERALADYQLDSVARQTIRHERAVALVAWRKAWAGARMTGVPGRDVRLVHGRARDRDHAG